MEKISSIVEQVEKTCNLIKKFQNLAFVAAKYRFMIGNEVNQPDDLLIAVDCFNDFYQSLEPSTRALYSMELLDTRLNFNYALGGESVGLSLGKFAAWLRHHEDIEKYPEFPEFEYWFKF